MLIWPRMFTDYLYGFWSYIKPYTYNNTHNHKPISAIALKLLGNIHLLTANYSGGSNLYGESPKLFHFTLSPNINTLKILAVCFAIKW